MACFTPPITLSRTLPTTFCLALLTKSVIGLNAASFRLPANRSLIVILAYSGKEVLCLISSNLASVILVNVRNVVYVSLATYK